MPYRLLAFSRVIGCAEGRSERDPDGYSYGNIVHRRAYDRTYPDADRHTDCHG